MPRCLSEGVDIFLKSVKRQGESGHDVRVSRSASWMARVGDPVMMRTTVSLFIRKFTPGDATSRRDVPFAVGVRPVYANPTLRMILCQKLFCVSNAVSVQRKLFSIAHDDFTESQLLHVSAVEDELNGRGKEGGMIFNLGE